MVRKLALCAILAMCLALVVPASAGTLVFQGTDLAGQGLLSFTPGVGNVLTIGAGNGGNGALITELMNTLGICGGNCTVNSGYLTLSSGLETSGFSGGGAFQYTFAAGGLVQVFGIIPGKVNVSSLLFSAAFLPNAIFTGAGTVGSYVGSLNLTSIFLNAALGTYKFSGGSNDDISISLDPACATGGVCSGSIFNTTSSLQTIPEPATLSVLGAGLFAFGAGVRRRVLAR